MILENLEFRLGVVQKEINKQENEYLSAVKYGYSTKAAVYRLIALEAEEHILQGLIFKHKQISHKA